MQIMDTIIKMTANPILGSSLIKINMQVGSLRIRNGDIAFDQPKKNLGDKTTLQTKSKAPTLTTRTKSTLNIHSKAKEQNRLCDPLVASPEAKLANDILKNHQLSTTKNATQLDKESDCPSTLSKSRTVRKLRKSIFEASAPKMQQDL